MKKIRAVRRLFQTPSGMEPRKQAVPAWDRLFALHCLLCTVCCDLSAVICLL